MRRPRPAVVVLIGSLLLLIGAPLAWAGFVASGRSDAAAVEGVGQRPTSEVDQVDASPSQPQVAGADVERIGVPVIEASEREAIAPVSIGIPAIAVQAAVDPVGVYEDGSVEIPEDITRVGWYRFGAGPGQGAGSTVIVGHRDGVDDGRGAFYSISALEPGDTVELQLANGSVNRYEVVAREAIDRELLPSDELFAESGPERLTLISCIGYFDRNGGGYQQNVIVTAVPVSTGVDS